MTKENITFKELYDRQIEFQKIIGNYNIPNDDPELFSHHALGMVTEIGEVLQADKRWKKNGRNRHYDKNEKLEEISDVFIFLLNMLIYSDINPEDILKNVDKKISINIERYFDVFRDIKQQKG